MMSPGIFKSKQQSRFKFAHSVDPIKSLQKQLEDEEEIQVPKNIQDLIVRNIRTLSNSLSTIKSSEYEGHKAINKALVSLEKQIDLQELRDKWYTKKELQDRSESINCNTTTKEEYNLTRVTVTSGDEGTRKVAASLRATR